MKKITMLISTLLIGSFIYAQQNPTGNPGNSRDWRRGGNLLAPPGQGGSNNIFGTMWNSPIYTYTNGIARMLINDGSIGPASGRIAMSNSLPAGFAPAVRLHLHETFNSRVVTKFTNSSTGFSATDGLDIGYRANQFAEINNRENTSMKFYTNNTERITINATGEIVINNLACDNCLVIVKVR